MNFHGPPCSKLLKYWSKNIYGAKSGWNKRWTVQLFWVLARTKFTVQGL